MKIEKYMVHEFEPEEGQPKFKTTIEVPIGSKLLSTVLLPDGIWAMYEIPTLATGGFENVEFEMYNYQEGSTPVGKKYVATHVVFTEQGAIIFNLYMQE